MTKIQALTRRTGGTGAHGVFLETIQGDGTALRALIAGPVLATQELSADAKGARWQVNAYNSTEDAQAALSGFFGDSEAKAALVDLTSVDVDRLTRGVNISATYPLLALLDKARSEDS